MRSRSRLLVKSVLGFSSPMYPSMSAMPTDNMHSAMESRLTSSDLRRFAICRSPSKACVDITRGRTSPPDNTGQWRYSRWPGTGCVPVPVCVPVTGCVQGALLIISERVGHLSLDEEARRSRTTVLETGHSRAVCRMLSHSPARRAFAFGVCANALSQSRESGFACQQLNN